MVMTNAKAACYDLAVAYRIYPRVSGTPPAYTNDKLKLSALCARSFKAALGALRVKMWVLLDGCPPEYETIFTDLWGPSDLVLVRCRNIGNRATFLEQIRLLSEQTHASLVYLAEDDYFYLPAEMATVVKLMNERQDMDFVTPYDHPDYHNLRVHRHRQASFENAGHRWKTVPTTTCTFLTRRSTLLETRAVFESYYRPVLFNRVTDNAVWLALTKHRAFNPFNMIGYVFAYPFWGWGFFIAWLSNWRQILTGRTYRLWAPEPSIATHMVSGLLGVGVDWEREFHQTSEPTLPQRPQ